MYVNIFKYTRIPVNLLNHVAGFPQGEFEIYDILEVIKCYI